jgi:hypothetical protein
MSINSIYSGNIQDFSKFAVICTGTAFGAIAVKKLAPLIEQYIFKRRSVFFGSPILSDRLPDQAWNFMRASSIPGNIIYSLITNMTNAYLPSFRFREEMLENIAMPILEEVEYRWCVQHICLSVLLGIAFKKFAPTQMPIVHSMAAKVCRTIITAGFFALGHTVFWGKGHKRFQQNGVFPQFLSGLVYSSLYESTGTLKYSIVAHIIHNTAVDILNNLDLNSLFVQNSENNNTEYLESLLRTAEERRRSARPDFSSFRKRVQARKNIAS